MREIKFRAWDIEGKAMWSWDELQDDWEADCYYDSVFRGDHWAPMQYTGLKDKNGVEVYEGDIVERKDYCGIKIAGFVQFTEYQNNESKHYGWNVSGTPLIVMLDGWSEVIGNIYENPELMK